jgi:hypothetical protein
MSHDDGLDALQVALAEAGVHAELFHDCIHIAFSSGHGVLEVKAWSGGERTVHITLIDDAPEFQSFSGEFDGGAADVAARILRKAKSLGLDLSLVGPGCR